MDLRDPVVTRVTRVTRVTSAKGTNEGEKECSSPHLCERLDPELYKLLWHRAMVSLEHSARSCLSTWWALEQLLFHINEFYRIQYYRLQTLIHQLH